MSTRWYLSDEQARCTGVPTATASTTTDEGHIPGRNTCRAMGREKAGAAVDINFHSLEAPHPGSPESFDFCRMWIGPKLAPQTLATGTQLTLAAGFNAGGGSVNFWLWGFVYLWRGGARVATLYGDTTDTEGVQGGAEVNPETPCVWRELAFPALTAPVTVQEGDRIVVEAWAREYDETGDCIGHGLHLVYAGTDDDYDDGDLLVDGDAAAYLEANNTIEESTEMPTITDWYPLIVEPSTTEVTIKGTGFKAAQGDGTVTVGGKALTSVTWGDTSIVGKIAADCPYGANDVVVTNSDGVAVTVVDAFQCIDPTVRKDTAEVLLGQMGSLYINGVDVGYCEDEVGYKPGGTVLDYRPNDRNTIVKSWRINREDTLRFTLNQLNGPNLAIALGGTWDATNNLLVLDDDAELPERAICWTDSAGNQYWVGRAQLVDAGELVFSPATWRKMAVSFRALATVDGHVFMAYMPPAA